MNFVPRMIVAVSFLAFVGCSGATPAPDERTGPEWVRQPVRTVDHGYVIYVGLGEDAQPDKARFKAEGAALGDLANECSFPPKGARIEDRFERVQGIVHQSYVKAAVDFQSCEEAKAANDIPRPRPVAVDGLRSRRPRRIPRPLRPIESVSVRIELARVRAEPGGDGAIEKNAGTGPTTTSSIVSLRSRVS